MLPEVETVQAMVSYRAATPAESHCFLDYTDHKQGSYRVRLPLLEAARLYMFLRQIVKDNGLESYVEPRA